MQNEMHVRKLLAESRDRTGERVTRLRVRRRDQDLATVRFRELIGEPFDVGGIEQDTVDDLRQLLAGLRQTQKPFAAAHEKLDPELVLQILDVLRNAGLGCVERVRNFGQVEIAAECFADNAELLEVHDAWVPF